MLGSGNTGSDQLDPSLQHEPHHVLLIDNDPIQQRTFASLLKQADFQVTLENNGLAAIDTIRRNKCQIDLIVIDIEVPYLTGIEFAKEIRERGETIPVLAISARRNVGLERECWQAGCDGFLIKPFLSAQFLTQVRRLVGIGVKRRQDQAQKKLLPASQSPHSQASCSPAPYSPAPSLSTNTAAAKSTRSIIIAPQPVSADPEDASPTEFPDPIKNAIDWAISKINSLPVHSLQGTTLP